MTMRKLLAEVRELTESVRSCGCRSKLCATCQANLDRIDFKSRDVEDLTAEEATRHDLRSRSFATTRNARHEGVASDNHREAVLARGAANALRTLLHGEATMCPHARPTGTPCPHCLGIDAGSPPPKAKAPRERYWADGRDVLAGEHEADVGTVAKAADEGGAKLIARLLSEHYHVDHGRGDDSGPDDSDCPCRATRNQAACAKAGCGFCLAATSPVVAEGDEVTLTLEHEGKKIDLHLKKHNAKLLGEALLREVGP